MSMSISIGVAIPCYKPHIPKLFALLDSINKQTVLPKVVVISCSSCTPQDIPIFPQYNFNYNILIHNERKNAAQNRNIAMAEIDTDIITFIDADDIMLPQRLEVIQRAYNEGARLIIHNYTQDSSYQPLEGEKFAILHWAVFRARTGCLQHYWDWRIAMHHSQVSVGREVIGSIKFNEGADFERREDAIFCGDVAAKGYQTAYIVNILSKYEPAGHWVNC
jgi:glycosyltransferase involved in cell wall biosynthesis